MSGNDVKFNLGDSLKSDIPAGIVVFLVALPLCLGISLASGAEPITGVLAGIVGGVIVGILSKSALGVAGPAAGIATLISGMLSLSYVSFETFLLIAFFAGLFQILFGVIKAGVIADYFPVNVVKGMLAAIGMLIVLKQIPHGLGHDADAEGELAFKQPDGSNTFMELINAVQKPHVGAIVITVISLGILLLWQSKFFKNNKFLSLIPAPLIVVVFGILCNLGYDSWAPGLALHDNHLVSIPDFGSLSNFTSLLQHPDYHILTTPVAHYEGMADQIRDVLVMSLKLAVVLSLQTLLSSEAADKLDPYKRVTPANQELIAQGIGNSISALIGGLPLTQVIVRSSANVNSGAKTKLSTVIHGVLLLLAVALIPNLLNMIPLACLAAILFMIGYKLASVNLFKHMYGLGMRQFIPFIVTIGAIILTDLLTGIIIGLIVSIFFILQNNRNNEPFDVKIKSSKIGKKTVYKAVFFLHEEVTYLSKHILMTSLQDLPDESTIVVDGSESRFIAQDIIETLQDFEVSVAPRKGIDFTFKHKPDLNTRKIDEAIINQLGGGSQI